MSRVKIKYQPDGTKTDLDGNKLYTQEELLQLPYEQAKIEYKRGRGDARGFENMWRKHHQSLVNEAVPTDLEHFVDGFQTAFALCPQDKLWVVKKFTLSGVHIKDVTVSKPEYKQFATARLHAMLLEEVVNE